MVDKSSEDQKGITVLFDDFLDPALKAKELGARISWVSTQKKREYAAGLIALKIHKSVDVRRRCVKALMNVAHTDYVEELEKWQSSESDREVYLGLESLIDKLKRGVLDHVEVEESKVLSVTEAIEMVKSLVGSKEYTIEGELSEVKPIRQMYYFNVKDNQETRLNCWLFSGIVARLGFPLNDGLQVRIKGQFKFSKDSRLYFSVQSITLTGEGELLRNLKMLEDKLTKEGLFDLARKRKLSLYPKRILLLASESSAALQDFIKVISHRRTALCIYHLPIKTQGVGAEFDLWKGLQRASVLCNQLHIDTVVLTRGGGSYEDLQLFNSEKIIRAIYGLPKPSIVAIGHERDVTLAEMAADVRASTPSNAAELASLSNEEVILKVQATTDSIYSIYRQRHSEYKRVAILLYQKIIGKTKDLISGHKLILQKIDTSVLHIINETRDKTDKMWSLILFLSNNLINYNRGKHVPFLKYLILNQKDRIIAEKSKNTDVYSLIFNNAVQLIDEKRSYLELLVSEIEKYDQKQILEQGYAIIFEEVSVIESIEVLKVKNKIKIKLKDGENSFVIKQA